jgi:ketosteroid isomerase-like protein
MPHDDVEILRAAYEALNRGDIPGTVAVLDADAEWHEHSELPEADSYRGREVIQSFLESFLESWDDFRQEVEDLIAEDGKVLILLHMIGQGKGSGIRVEARYAHLWTMREGRGVRVDTYTDREEALEALHAAHAG